MRGLQRLVFAAALALTALSSQAVGVVRVVPQGEVAQVRQLVIGFDAPAVRLGDAQASAPVTTNFTSAGAAAPLATASAIPLCRAPRAPDQSMAAKWVNGRIFGV